MPLGWPGPQNGEKGVEKGVGEPRGTERQCIVPLIYLGQEEVNGSQKKKKNNQRLKMS